MLYLSINVHFPPVLRRPFADRQTASETDLLGSAAAFAAGDCRQTEARKKRDGKRADTVEKFLLKIAAFMPFNGLLWRIVSHLDDNITRAPDDTPIKTNIHAPSYMLQLFYFSEIATLLFY